jgi:hypothetical protein
MTYNILDERWYEKYAWLPVRSTWSKKLIWLNMYHAYEYQYMKKDKIFKNRFIYTKNEYIMMILNNRYEE